ncbi:trypsin-like peptidase domain-containing protein [Stieleria varia]
MIEMHNAIPESPYAGLWAAVALSHGSNEHVRASVILKSVVQRIEKQREIDPERHRMTLASANNNLAVCLIKSKRGDSAAAKLVEAIESCPQVPAVVRSNAHLLNEATSGLSPVVFSPNGRTKLLRALATANSPGSGTEMQGLHYSLDFDLPESFNGAQKISGIDSPRSDLMLLAQGTGFVVAPGLVLTSRQVVETTNYNGPKLLTIVTNPSASTWRSELVESVKIHGVKRYATSATIASYNSGSTAYFTNYVYIPLASGHSDAELAALVVPNLNVSPLEIAKSSPVSGSDLQIVGYGRGKDAITSGLQVERGVVVGNSTTSVSSLSPLTSSFGNSRVMQTTARVMGGNRGAPITDKDNNVVGIAFDTPAGGTNAAGWFFGASELRRWFYKNVQTASILDPDPQKSPAERDAALRSATIPVFCWGLRGPSSQQVFSRLTDSSRLNGSVYIRDGWCVACDGTGFFDCPNKLCNKGAVAGRASRQLGTTVDGTPIRGSTVTREVCPTCRGRGIEPCPHCKGGRL